MTELATTESTGMADSGARIFLVVPNSSTNPRTGGGQRTGIFFSAARSVAPTEVIVIGTRLSPELASFFPGARAVHAIEDTQFNPLLAGSAGRAVRRLRQFADLRGHYAPDEALRKKTLALTKWAGPSVVIYRYTLLYSRTGLFADPGPVPPLMVDVDDRDDQKLATEFARVFGSAVTGRILEPLKLAPLRRHLGAQLRRARHVWVSAAEDLAAFDGATVSLQPNVPFSTIGGDPAQRTPASAARDVLFVGNFWHLPNRHGVRWFLDNCWPTLHRRFPQVRFRVVGLGDWGSLAAGPGGIDGVDLVGTVEDIGAEYAHARMAISPVAQGGGSKIKVIEACAHARPVVTTPHSARGFSDSITRSLAIAATPEEFINACAHFIETPQDADAAGSALHEAQVREYSRTSAEDGIARTLRAALGTDLPDKVAQ